MARSRSGRSRSPSSNSSRRRSPGREAGSNSGDRRRLGGRLPPNQIARQNQNAAPHQDEGFCEDDEAQQDNVEKDPPCQPPGPLTPTTTQVEQTQSQGEGLAPPDSDDEQGSTPAPATLTPFYGGNREVPNNELNEEQRLARQLVVTERKSACILGPGGTGKSTLNKAIQADFRDRGVIAHAVAPTGIAAIQTHGSTIHSLFKIPGQLNRGIRHFLKLTHSQKTCLRAMDVLILDEISMVSSQMFELLHRMLQVAKSNREPFGGVQVIVLGDFGQLPPIKPFEYCLECGRMRKIVSRGVWSCQVHGRAYEDDQWAFRASVWDEINFEPVWLSQNHRQRDQKFAKIIDDVWNGRPFSRKQRDLLLNHRCHVVNAVRLYCTNEARENYNKTEFEKLDGTAYEYNCKDKFIMRHDELAHLGDCSSDRTLKALLCHSYEDTVSLKEEMPVVLTHNLDTKGGLVNGAQGVVTGFQNYNETNLPRPRYHPDYFSPEDDDLEADVMSVNGGHWVSLRQDCIREYMQINKKRPLPIVHFNNGKKMVIWPDCSIAEHGFGGSPSLLIRTQIPLIPGWALTIHKAQGMTLDRVIINLNKVFSFGQVYVALSRARSLEGLHVEELDPKAGTFTMPDAVKEFLETTFDISVG